MKCGTSSHLQEEDVGVTVSVHENVRRPALFLQQHRLVITYCVSSELSEANAQPDGSDATCAIDSRICCHVSGATDSIMCTWSHQHQRQNRPGAGDCTARGCLTRTASKIARHKICSGMLIASSSCVTAGYLLCKIGSNNS